MNTSKDQFFSKILNLLSADEVFINAIKIYTEILREHCDAELGHILTIKQTGEQPTLVSSRIWCSRGASLTLGTEELSALTNQNRELLPFKNFISVTDQLSINEPTDNSFIALMAEESQLTNFRNNSGAEPPTEYPRYLPLKSTEIENIFSLPIHSEGLVVAVIELFIKTSHWTPDRKGLIDFTAKLFEQSLNNKTRRAEQDDTIQALRMAQTQLIQSEKMASLGTVAAGVAHEINNPLSFILSNTETLGQYIKTLTGAITSLISPNSPPGAKPLSREEQEEITYVLNDINPMIAETLEGIMRVREIVQGLKAFSRADDSIQKRVSVNELIENSLKLLANETKYKCKVHTVLEPVPEILGFPGQLMQVFTNLVLNSVQAIEKSGVITIRSRLRTPETIELRFEDNGKGIAPEDLENLFLPFFTTKPVGSGTGLGLSISYGIVRNHGGSISVTSTLGEGTCFCVTLPCGPKK